MNTILLSGVGGSTNWLPLILPLLCIVAILKFGETAIHFIKRKKLEHENRIINSVDDAPTSNIEQEL